MKGGNKEPKKCEKSKDNCGKKPKDGGNEKKGSKVKKGK
jgi:hypothetical protein